MKEEFSSKWPFRLGAPSWIIPGDILPNVRFLAGLVDDVELVLFESQALPTRQVIDELKILARENNLSYTVHLPLDTWLGHVDAGIRLESVEKCLRVMDLTRPLNPFAWVCHLHKDQPGPMSPEQFALWRANSRKSLGLLLEKVPPVRLCVETLEYDFGLVSEIVQDLGLSICLDVGHCLISGQDAGRILEEHLPRVRVVHLHGTRGTSDHKSLKHLDEKFLKDLLSQLLADYKTPRVVTLETFKKDYFLESFSILTDHLPDGS